MLYNNQEQYPAPLVVKIPEDVKTQFLQGKSEVEKAIETLKPDTVFLFESSGTLAAECLANLDTRIIEKINLSRDTYDGFFVEHPATIIDPKFLTISQNPQKDALYITNLTVFHEWLAASKNIEEIKNIVKKQLESADTPTIKLLAIDDVIQSGITIDLVFPWIVQTACSELGYELDTHDLPHHTQMLLALDKNVKDTATSKKVTLNSKQILEDVNWLHKIANETFEEVFMKTAGQDRKMLSDIIHELLKGKHRSKNNNLLDIQSREDLHALSTNKTLIDLLLQTYNIDDLLGCSTDLKRIIRNNN